MISFIQPGGMSLRVNSWMNNELKFMQHGNDVFIKVGKDLLVYCSWWCT